MSVILNEAALTALLDTEEGPVGRHMQEVSQRIVGKAQQNVRDYFQSAPSLNVDQDVGFDMEGSSAVIGIRDGGKKARRLAQYASDDSRTVNWLVEARGAGR